MESLKNLENLDNKENIKMQGHFKLTARYDDGTSEVLVDQKNLIVDLARYRVLDLIEGKPNEIFGIRRFVLGTDGVDSNNNPKTFDGTRTQTFSEESGTEYWDIKWTIDTDNNNEITIVSEEGNPANNSTIVVTRDDVGFTVNFHFEIPEENANGTGVRQYSEAALYLTTEDFSDQALWSMRTFHIRSKDNTIAYDIDWTLQIA